MWGLGSPAVQKDYRKLRCPPLELFEWSRCVLDEFTYVKAQDRMALMHFKARCKWVLSGTPPHGSFEDVKSIAQFLGVHLGVDETPHASYGKGDVTTAEAFHSFREARSVTWQARRRALAQRFLDDFVRQNIAEIDEIRVDPETERRVVLPPAERAIYLELEAYIAALDMQTKKKASPAGASIATISAVTSSSPVPSPRSARAHWSSCFSPLGAPRQRSSMRAARAIAPSRSATHSARSASRVATTFSHALSADAAAAAACDLGFAPPLGFALSLIHI